MKQTWREYGVIAVLLVVAVGGYLLVSRNQDDVLRYSLNLVGDHLVALVPEGPDRERVAAAVDSFKDRVEAREVPAGQVEAFAANVFNLGSSGSPVHAEEAEMVLKMALDEADLLPRPALAAGSGAEEPFPPARVRPRVPSPPSSEELAQLGARLESMTDFYVNVRDHVASDSAHALMRFYADDGLHVIIDEEAKNQFVVMEAAEKLEKVDLMAWKSRFAEVLTEERHRHASEADKIEHLRSVLSDSLISQAAGITALALLRRMESRGVAVSAEVESLAVSIEKHIERLVPEPVRSPGVRVEVISASALPETGR